MAKIKLLTFDKTAGTATYNIGSGTTINAKVEGTKVIINGYGTFDLTDASKTVFVADAGLTGELAIEIDSGVAGATLTKADLSKASGVKFVENVALAEIIGTAGNDYIKAGHTTAVNVTLGAGADTLELDEAAANEVNLADYNYYQGDVIKATGQATVDSSGKMTVQGSAQGTVTGSNIAVEDNW